MCIHSLASVKYAIRRQNCDLSRYTSFCVNIYDPVKKSCVAAMSGSPLRGEIRFRATRSNSAASALKGKRSEL